MANSTTYVTADGQAFAHGDTLFSHYSMREGVVDASRDGGDGWVYFVYAEGDRDLLNGERMCSLAHARYMGWLR